MRIAVIAHDGKKAEMVRFLTDHFQLFKRKDIQLVATGTTGKHVLAAGLIVELVQSGPMGGDAQIAAQVTEGKIQMVLFFRDPLDKHPHEPDINMLMRLCDVHNIPLGTNPAAGSLLLAGLLVQQSV